MRLFKFLLLLLLSVTFFLACLLFIVSNADPLVVDLLVPGWRLEITQGAALLLAFVAGSLFGSLVTWGSCWATRKGQHLS